MLRPDMRLQRIMPETPPLPEAVRRRIKKRFFGTTAPEEPPGRTFLKQFCRAVRRGNAPPPGHLLLVVQGLERLLAGETAGAAFGLNAGKGNKRTEDRQLRDKVIDAEVEELRAEWGRGKLADALELVAARYNRDSESIRKIYLSHQRGKRETQAWHKRLLREVLHEE